MQTLTEEEVTSIHYALVEEFKTSGNPIFPPGVKSKNLLASAVGRQHTSLGPVTKYPDPSSNAASLIFGLICDHPFHNGNKRTALVSLLAHLHKNKLSFIAEVEEPHLYDLVISIASHEVALDKRKSRLAVNRPLPDDEVDAVARWIRGRIRPIQKGERQITYRQLRQVLEHFGFELDNAKDNSIDVFKHTTTVGLLFGRTPVRVKIGNIPYPGERALVGVGRTKHIRRLCRLTAEDGFDSDTFYGEGQPVDAFIIRYRSILGKLANK